MMTEQIKEFIKHNIDAIDYNDFDTVYALADLYLPEYAITDLTEVLLSADINPLEYLSRIPPHYLEGSDIVDLEIPNNIQKISFKAFYGCKRLNYVYIPSSVRYISSKVFGDCTSLSYAVIENDQVDIDNFAFVYSPNVTIGCREDSTGAEFAKFNNYPTFEIGDN